MSPENLSLAYVDRKHILAVLRLCDANRTRAAKLLGISLRCLRNKLRDYRVAGEIVPESASESLYCEIGELLGSFARGNAPNDKFFCFGGND